MINKEKIKPEHLSSVIAHEFGHYLHLDHSPDPNSIMYPLLSRAPKVPTKKDKNVKGLVFVLYINKLVNLLETPPQMDNFGHLVQTVLHEGFLKASKKDPEDLPKFIEKRSAGAKKVQKTAEEKGGYSLLTAIHFKAKEVPYKHCLKHAEDETSDFVEKKADECFKKLKNWKKMSQREFQHVMGQLEAYGEVYIRSEENKKNG